IVARTECTITVLPADSFMCHSAATVLPAATPGASATTPSTAAPKIGAINALRTILDIISLSPLLCQQASAPAMTGRAYRCGCGKARLDHRVGITPTSRRYTRGCGVGHDTSGTEGTSPAGPHDGGLGHCH